MLWWILLAALVAFLGYWALKLRFVRAEGLLLAAIAILGFWLAARLIRPRESGEAPSSRSSTESKSGEFALVRPETPVFLERPDESPAPAIAAETPRPPSVAGPPARKAGDFRSSGSAVEAGVRVLGARGRTIGVSRARGTRPVTWTVRLRNPEPEPIEGILHIEVRDGKSGKRLGRIQRDVFLTPGDQRASGTTYFAARSRPQSLRAWFERAKRGPSLANVEVAVREPASPARLQPNPAGPDPRPAPPMREAAGLPEPDVPERESPPAAGDAPPDEPAPSPWPSLENPLASGDEGPGEDEIPEAIVTDKKGIVISPHRPHNLIDVEGFARGEIVMDPTVDRPMRVP